MPDQSATRHRLVMARVTRRLIPFAFLCYVIAYIDRVNIGFAKEALQRDLGLTNTAVRVRGGPVLPRLLRSSRFPSNLILERVGARRWIARIMIGWGLASMGTMFVTGELTFYAARIVLGIAEAGFFPGMVLYFTYWVPASDRARIGALFMMAAPVAIIVGAPVSEALLKLDGWLGLHGWQWLFLLEGLPAVVLGVLALKVLTDRPEQATWLPPADREWLAATMAEEHARRSASGHASLLRALASGRVWVLCAVYFLNTTVTYGIFLWLPRDAARSVRIERLRGQRVDDDPVHRGAGRDGADRQALRSHRRAKASRGRVRRDGRGRSAPRRVVREQHLAARPELDAVADGTAFGDQRLLGHPADLPRGHRRRRRHRADQLAGEPRRMGGSFGDRMAA